MENACNVLYSIWHYLLTYHDLQHRLDAKALPIAHSRIWAGPLFVSDCQSFWSAAAPWSAHPPSHPPLHNPQPSMQASSNLQQNKSACRSSHSGKQTMFLHHCKCLADMTQSWSAAVFDSSMNLLEMWYSSVIKECFCINHKASLSVSILQEVTW